MLAKRTTVPVSERALIQRINRKLRSNDEVLKTARGGRAEWDLGRYYVVDFNMNAVMQKDVDLESLGRELNALQKHEHLIED